ncbi:hypothetical protein ACFL26_01860 [Patescibacteria group bacterium]
MRKTLLLGAALLLALLVTVPALATDDATELYDGALIRTYHLSAVYYYNDGQRYVFPNDKAYFSWYGDFSEVIWVTAETLADIPIGGNVTYRPGRHLVKIVSSPKVYAVEAGGILRWIESEAAAVELYGEDWRLHVHDIPDAFFVNYRIMNDRPVRGRADYDPDVAVGATLTIAQDKAGIGASTGSSGSGSSGGTSGTTSGGSGSTSGGSGSTSSGCGSCSAPPPSTGTAPSGGTELINPSDFEYRGAFRLPEHPEWMGWEWGGDAMTHYPDGDAGGPADGYPGSLFGTGHAWNMNVGEFDIPAPVVSASRDAAALNRATQLQDFADVRGGLFDPFVEIIRVGMEYMPEDGRLHLAWGQHFQETGSPEDIPTHMRCDLDLAAPNTQGSWWIADGNNYATNDYMFAAPADWAAAHADGRSLLSGRYRDGGWSGQGPSLFAVAPWQDGDPPPPGAELGTTTLLQYETSYDNDALYSDSAHALDGYHHTDTWTGAAWLTAGDRAAVALVGTKGFGSYWYGDTGGPCLDCAGERGWWSDRMEATMILYDPADLAAVAAGTMEPWEPQPYATVSLEPFMWRDDGDQVMFQVGAMAFDRANSLLYVFEPLADEERPLVHVFALN